MHFKFDRAFVSSGALELDVRLIPTLLVVAHDSNVAVYAHLAAGPTLLAQRVDPRVVSRTVNNSIMTYHFLFPKLFPLPHTVTHE